MLALAVSTNRVPDVVIVPPDNPSPVATDVTVPDPAETHCQPVLLAFVLGTNVAPGDLIVSTVVPLNHISPIPVPP